ncbi:polysaccharide deacetylase family protein [Tumebacillus permanentifrigoris]|uniref:Peptidoglycan/xylan/chitin deacetylase (PgdA/CDA1 family) n=1 Tax=Tumebacillus permanentifrigoris TaxID=378543 RepID=A0A316D9Z9_9BACL|nr:polysaccharide deacetylase family protein [Tumebacillus permanentifrigoris]PWK14305.1 peptidoglycan/xylan/chitin deacetylase (PgdA/CDA1 family) [Tumebacillus permanentifrigoris]
MKKKRSIIALAIALVLFIYCITTYKLMSSRTYQVAGELVSRVETSQKVVALTFDDGPSGHTDDILKTLEQADVQATFFLIGTEIEKRPEDVKKLLQAGHEIGNHTYHHNRMIFKSPSYLRDEVEKTDQLLRDAGVTGEILFRPPNGKKLLYLPYYLSQHDRKTIMWNLEPDSLDEIASSADQIVEYTLTNIQPGSIILLHAMYDSRAESLKAVQGIVSGLKAQGYQFKTVSELLQMQGK